MSAHATVRELSELVDRQLDERRRRALESHLEDCGRCRERLAGLRRIAAGLGSLPPLEPPAELGRRVELGVRRVAARVSWRERLEGGLRRSLIQPVLLPVLAVVLALTVILYVFSEGLARIESRGTTRLVIEPRVEAPAAPEGGGEPPAPAVIERRVADRWFDRIDGAWVERGLAGKAPTARFDLTRGGPAERAGYEARLAPFAVLGGTVRLELDGEIVEAVFPPPQAGQPPEPPGGAR